MQNPNPYGCDEFQDRNEFGEYVERPMHPEDRRDRMKFAHLLVGCMAVMVGISLLLAGLTYFEGGTPSFRDPIGMTVFTLVCYAIFRYDMSRRR